MLGQTLETFNTLQGDDRSKLENLIKHHADKFIQHVLKVRMDKMKELDHETSAKWQTGALFLAEDAIKMGYYLQY